METAIRHTAFVMGNCLRLMTKEEYVDSAHIQRTTKDRLLNLFDHHHAELWCPLRCPVTNKLAVLVIEGYSEAPYQTVAGFWSAACVLSMSYTGLGAIGWFVKAHEKLLMSGKD